MCRKSRLLMSDMSIYLFILGDVKSFFSFRDNEKPPESPSIKVRITRGASIVIMCL